MSFDPDFGRVVPVDVTLKIGDGWRKRQVGTPRAHQHQGVDIALPLDTPILAAADGLVVTAHPLDNNDAGIHVAVDHGNGLTSRYLHLSRLSVAKGQRVSKGQEVGRSGNTGLSEGPHLHFDLWAKEELLPTIVELVGKPPGGFGVKFSYGIAIPTEPWLPGDSYSATVIASALAQGIPLYRARSAPTGMLSFSLVVTGLFLGALAGMVRGIFVAGR